MTRRASRALLSLVLLLGVSLATLGNAFGNRIARADDAPTAAPGPSVVVGLTAISPLIPKGDPAEMYSISGAVKNVGQGIQTVFVHLRVSQVGYPYDAATQVPTGTNGWLPFGSKSVPINGGTLSPQSQSNWEIPPMKMSDLLRATKPTSGVYAVDVVAADASGLIILGVQRTFLVWKPMTPGSGATQVSVALMWPMVGTPALTSGTDPNTNQIPVLADLGNLTTQIQTDGRLGRVVRIGKALGQVPNWIVDPDLLATAAKLKAGYVSGGALGNGVSAGTWLDAATSTIKGQSCWNLPNSDPDLASVAHDPGGLALLKNAPLAVGIAAPGCDRQDKVLAWPGSGESDTSTTAAIHQVLPKATALVTNTFYTDLQKSGYATHVSLDGTVGALVSDKYLSDVFAPRPDDGVSNPGVLAGQRWLAQTALLARDGLTNHAVIAAPPRDFEPTDELLTAIQREGQLPAADQWMKFSTLEAIQAAKAVKVTTPAKQLPDTAKANLNPKVVADAVTTESVYSAYLAVLGASNNSDPVVPYRTVATSLRGHPDLADRYAAAVQDQVKRHHNAVFLSKPSALTLSGKSGKIPITIVNNLPHQVLVNVQGSSDLKTRLSITSQPGDVTVPANSQRTVEISVHAVGSGQIVNVTAKLFQPGPDAAPYYPPGTDTDKLGEVTAPVRVSAIGIIALTLMIGSAAVLVGAIGVRVYRANRAHHAAGHDTMAS